MQFKVQETTASRVVCPCGCGKVMEQLDGSLTAGEGGAFYRAMLMRHADGAPQIWLSVVTKAPLPAEPDQWWADGRDWLVTMRAMREGARIEDPDNAPTLPPSFDGHIVKREQAMALPGIPQLYFACFDALMQQHSRMASFMREEPTAYRGS